MSTGHDRRPIATPWRLLAALTAMGLLLTACGGSDTGAVGDTDSAGEEVAVEMTDATPSEDGSTDGTAVGGDLTVGTINDPSNLDPATGRSGNDYNAIKVIFDTLVDYDPATLEPTPGLAESWEYRGEDELEFVLQIREGVTFHDGTTLDAEAVRASLQYYIDADVRNDLDPVVGMEVEDPYTLVLELGEPYGVLPALLADRAGMVISPTAIEASPDDLMDHPVGTGPYMVESWNVDVDLTMVAFEDYWDGAPALDSMTMRFFEDEGSMISALSSGQIQYAFPIDPSQLPVIEGSPDLEATVTESLQFTMLRISQEEPPLDSREVRQALNLAIDREGLTDTMLGDLDAHPGALPVPPGYYAHTDGEYVYDHDPERARELLVEAGYEDGVTVELCPASSTPERTRILQILQEQLQESNIELAVSQVPGSGCIDEFYAGDWNAMLTGHTGRVDPWFTYSEAFASWGANNMNHGEPIHPDIDAALVEIATISDLEVQADFYGQINDLFIEEAPTVALWFRPIVDAAHTSVAGNLTDLQGKVLLRGLHVTE